MDLRSVLAPRLVAHAHCDIPCGIYDPTAAKIAADTVAKMVEKITGAEATDLANRNTFIRSVQVKEEHAQICKKELLILWTDYFKPEHLEQYPDLHTLFWNATKAAGESKKSVDPAVAQKTIDLVAEIEKIFWETKKA
jgi:nickel superoxide dismutase